MLRQHHSTRKLSRRTLLARTLALGSLAGLLAACRREEEAPPPERSPVTSGGAAVTPPVTQVTTPQPTAEATTQGIVVFASAVDIPNIDPAVGHDGAISETQKALYDTLYRHLGNPPELVPWLATSHEVSEDAREWTFTLDERAKFQDGSPVTADAIVYSAQRLLKINKGVAWMFKGILTEAGVEAVDDHTVKFTLEQPFAPFLHATAWLFVLNPKVVQEHEQGGDLGQAWLISNSAGSGPFKIKRWEPGRIYEFESDPNYWRGWEGPRLRGYVRQVVRESSTKRLMLERGEIHFADWMSVEDIQLLKNVPGVVVPEEPSIATYTIKLNNKRGPTADVNVRRAISYAFDYNALLEVMAGRAVRIYGPLAPSLPGVKKDLRGYETDIERAKAELAKSPQWKDGFEIEYMYVTGLEEERKTGLILLDQLSKLNITVKITPVEWANAVALFADPEQSPLMFPIYSGSDYPDPDNFLWQSFHSSSAGTWMGANHYSNSEVDRLLEEARATTDWDKRAQLYARVQEIVVDEAVEIFCFSQVGGLPYRDVVQGYEYCPVMGSSPFWYRISLKE